ncbi:MAG: hypothetical protein H6821_16635 [Planctomycetaceae bacterium]|nr:hypothetical protein [Planctomycetales bacterium]MCB9875799.1 hypothetical protein [Planctomycetaceae bacterium]MCB9940646.1 hypothetical protein [Planctomycetaceae bacterium]HRX77979.1 hypothetical protein [Pirellulaceae bacterium]
MSQVTNRVSEQMHAIQDESKEFVAEHALPTALAVFGIGVGAGLAVASMLVESSASRHSTTTQRLGQQMLDAMARVLPDSLMKH